MVRLCIDGVEVMLRTDSIQLPGYDAEKLHSVERWRQGSEIVVEVVSTPESDRVMRYAFDLHCGDKFNSELHRAQMDIDGIVVFEGMATLLSTEQRADTRYYRLRLRSGGSDWADDVARRELNDSRVECSVMMHPAGIESTWVEDTPVRFLPIRRDSYPKYNESSLWSAERVLMPNDYHPFLSVRHIIESIAAASGYKLKSRWLESELAGKLMISGAFKQVDCAEVDRMMGFKAYRTKSATATAGVGGILFAWETQSLGAIVDSVSPDAVDEEGNVLSDAYNNGGALQFVDGLPVFTPKRQISVSFEYHIKYRTDYNIVSSSELQGFNRVRLGLGCDVELRLENPYTSRHEELNPNTAYKLFIFDYDPSQQYMLLGVGEVSGRVSRVVTSSNCPRSTQLCVRSDSDAEYQPYTGDWALYNGFVEPTGSREVEFVVRTPYVEFSPSSPKQFNNVAFYGATEGQSMTLLSGCSVRTIFGGVTGYGHKVKFSDVANHRFTQQRLLEALAHMFNLCFYPHEPSKTLIIEPYDDFFSGAMVDWRRRQLPHQWSIVEGAPQSSENVRIAYAGSDGVVSRANDVSDKEFGVWSRYFEGYGTKHGVDIRLNPILLPTISTNGFLGSAASAEVLTVGDRDAAVEGDYIEPRVVLYHGIQPLPEDERWSSMTAIDGYPCVAFHSATLQQSLCFEDRDGCTGLHTYYDQELSEIAERGLLQCKIHLPLAEYVALLDPDSESATIRSRFRLEVDGAESLYTLRSIEAYDAERGVATCLFRRCTTDS